MDEEPDSAAEEVARLRQTIVTIALIVAALLLAVVVWLVVQKANRDSEKNADEFVECIRAGRSDCGKP